MNLTHLLTEYQGNNRPARQRQNTLCRELCGGRSLPYQQAWPTPFFLNLTLTRWIFLPYGEDTDRGGSQSWRLLQRKGNLLLKGKTVPLRELGGKTSCLEEGKLKSCILTRFRSLQLFISLGSSLHLESEGSKPVSSTSRLRQINTMKYFYTQSLFISTSKSFCWFED